MPQGRRILLALAVVAAGAAALVANVALLGLANETDDPVGRLRPVLAGTVIRPSAPVETTSVETPPPTSGGTVTDDHGGGDRDDHDEDDD